jgi:hypothetical protein
MPSNIIEYNQVEEHADQSSCQQGIKFVPPVFPEKQSNHQGKNAQDEPDGEITPPHDKTIVLHAQ